MNRSPPNRALPADVERQADAAAARGDLSSAAALLEQVTADAPDRIDTWLKLAAIRRAMGKLRSALVATDGALAADPLHFMALLSRARLLETLDEAGEAARAYVRALAQLPEDQPHPPALEPVIARARAIVADHHNGVAASWARAAGRDASLTGSERLDLDRFTSNALRQTRVYHSEPSHYHHPGLIEREFHRREAFPWLAVLEQATPTITAELQALLGANTARAEPYIQYPPGTPVRQWQALNHSLDWTALHLLQGGRAVEANARHCPQTIDLLASFNQPCIRNRSPNAMFSLLKPGAHIPPHTGIANTRLVCHLPLIVPAGCWFRVGAERREWRVGEAFVFDDTIEHEAANESDEARLVLIFDVWHPGLSEGARAAVARIMEAEEAEQGAPL